MSEDGSTVNLPEEDITTKVVLATAGYDHTIRFWDVLRGVTVHSLQHAESQVNAMAVSRDKRTLAVAGTFQYNMTANMRDCLHLRCVCW